MLSGEKASLQTIHDHPATAFVFFAPDCPLSKNYTLTINNFQKDFKKDSVKFFVVYPGPWYEKQEIEEFHNTFINNTTALLDEDFAFTKKVSATVTPEVVLIDREGNIKYQGAIDNWAISLGKKRQHITALYLNDALVSLLMNNMISINKTEPIGCFIELD